VRETVMRPIQFVQFVILEPQIIALSNRPARNPTSRRHTLPDRSQSRHGVYPQQTDHDGGNTGLPPSRGGSRITLRADHSCKID
jgi:hypothetical protein